MSPFLQNLLDGLLQSVQDLGQSLPRLLMALIVFGIGYGIADIVRRTIFRAITRANLGRKGDTLDTVLSQLAFAIVLTLVGIIAMGVVGIDVTSLVAGLGLTSLAIGFALKDILENTISGLLILLSRSYVVGDIISVSGQEGEVSDISLRVTTILNNDGIETLIPNRLVYGSILQNRTARPVLRRSLEFPLAAGADARKAVATAVQAAQQVAPAPTGRPTSAEVVLNADGAQRLRLYYWVPSRDQDPLLATSLIAATNAALGESKLEA
ncbi:MAG: mechanosensitive ion channel family protein [Thermoflexales bacterium]|nr:mechanosensitive ion channel family protein [Thermoflexales bacterium]